MKLFQHIKENNHTSCIITDSNAFFSYSDIFQLVRSFSGLLDKKYLIFNFSSNSIGSVVGYISFLEQGSVSLLLDSKLSLTYIGPLLETYKPNFIWIPSDRVLEFPDFTVVFQCLDYVLLETHLDSDDKLNDDLALLLTTSGSTGSPKLVRLTKKNIQSNTESIVNYLSIKKGDRAITVLPMNYSYGLSIINTHLYSEATILLSSKSIIEKEFWSFFKNHQGTSFSGVPYTYEVLKKLKFFDMELPSLKILTQAGGKLRTDLVEEYGKYCLRSGRNFVVMYGQTEATARMSYLPSNMCIEKLGSIGVAIPNGKFELRNDQNQIIDAANENAELVYIGDNVSMGYAESRIDLSLGDINNKVLYTGDIAYCDSDGFFYIAGRKKRFIKIFGNRINLDEVEQIVKTDFTECACVGQDDKLMIYVVNNSKYSIPDFKKKISVKLSLHFSAIEVREIDQIPKNTSGKTIYNELS